MISFVRLMCLLAAVGCVGMARAQTYPDRPITVVIPYPPGGVIDPVMRIIQPTVAEQLGQPVVVENRGGAGGNIGSAFVSHAAPDGYTVLIATNAVLTTNPYLYKLLPFDAFKDLEPVTTVSKGSLVFAVHPSVPIHNIPELIAYAKQDPGGLTFGTAGFGSPFHIAGEFFKQRAGIDMVHVPFGGAAPLTVALLGGHIKMAISSLASMSPHVKEGKVRLVAVMDKERNPNFPDVQTVSETLPDIEASGWSAVMVPAGTPKPVIDRLHDVFSVALNTESNKAQIAALFQTIMADTPDQTADLIKREQKQWGDVIRATRIEPQ